LWLSDQPSPVSLDLPSDEVLSPTSVVTSPTTTRRGLDTPSRLLNTTGDLSNKLAFIKRRHSRAALYPESPMSLAPSPTMFGSNTGPLTLETTCLESPKRAQRFLTEDRKRVETKTPVPSQPATPTFAMPDNSLSDISTDDLRPCTNPSRELTNSFSGLSDERWDTNFHAITGIRRLATHHRDFLTQHQQPGLSQIVSLICGFVASLRSSLSKHAIMCLEEMFKTLNKDMDPLLESILPSLLRRMGEANKFINAQSHRTLSNMLNHCTKERCLSSLLSQSDVYRSAAIKTELGLLMNDCIEGMNPQQSRRLTNSSQFREANKLFLTCLQLASDSNPECRDQGKRLCYNMVQVVEQCNVDLSRLVGGDRNKANNFREAAEKYRSSGKAKPTLRTITLTTSSRAPSTTPVTPTTNTINSEELTGVYSSIGSGDWRERMEGITMLTDKLVLCAGRGVAMVQVFDNIIPRLSDANSKVNIHAFTSLNRMLPHISQTLSTAIPAQSNPDTTITRLLMAICNAMASTNPQIRDVSSTCFDVCLNSMDGALLTPCLPVALSANAKARVCVLERLSQNRDALKRMSESKPLAFTKHVVSLPVRIIRDTKAGPNNQQIRQANAALSKCLYSIMGEDIWKGMSSDEQRKIKDLLNS
jgi:hypothetical protein